MRRAFASLALLVVACGREAPAPFHVEVATTAAAPAWLEDAGLEARTLKVARAAASRWGGGELEGWTVRFVSEIGSCGGAAAEGAVMGCTRPAERTIELAVVAQSPCVEATALLHEVGHVALPADATHADPRWASGAFWSGLLGEVATDIAAGDTACAVDVAAWRQWWLARGR